MNKSIWSKYKSNLKTKELKGNIDTDILIIGGGLAGISTAFYLKDNKEKVVLIERNELMSGTSIYTTAKATFMQDSIYEDIEKCHNAKISGLYLSSQLDAIKMIKENVRKYNIDCDLKKEESYVFTNNKSQISKIKKLEEILFNNGIKYEIIKKLPNDIPCMYGIKSSNCATINPIKYAYGLINNISNLDIYEKVCAIKIKKGDGYYIIETDKNTITAKKVITATQYPFFIIPGLIPFKTHLKRSHVVASKVDKTYDFNAITIDDPTISIRYYEDKEKYLIFGGESYNMADDIDYALKQMELDKQFKSYFDYKIDYRWSTYDLVSNDYLPIVGEINENNKEHYIMTAFNAWGITNSVIAGKVISDLINNKKNKYIDLFKPSRPITIKRTINFIGDTFNFSKIFLKTKICKNKDFYNDDVKIVNIDGKSYGIYVDKNNEEHVVRNLCPHAKCSLIFNYQDKTWDCPCHGSRFDIDGNAIKGPSSYDIKVNKK